MKVLDKNMQEIDLREYDDDGDEPVVTPEIMQEILKDVEQKEVSEEDLIIDELIGEDLNDDEESCLMKSWCSMGDWPLTMRMATNNSCEESDLKQEGTEVVSKKGRILWNSMYLKSIKIGLASPESIRGWSQRRSEKTGNY